MLLCEERLQLQAILQILGTVKDIVFFAPSPINVCAVIHLEELVGVDFTGVIDGAIEGVRAGRKVGITAWSVLVAGCAVISM